MSCWVELKKLSPDVKSAGAPRIHRFQGLPPCPTPSRRTRVQDLELEVRLFETGALHHDNYPETRYAIVFWPKSTRLECASVADGVNALLHAA
ncbi:hypothetical protein SPRG_13174 [Saprolegnia parasitica CBS 223.65]|uniref:Uncharacterized protein n=1 Tax=Saprolegnia parasitica (strain CBS 223.65) TaxID=695850 RepID=A0A067BY46_SAPPC|nr:hypothetical protein SPRG_13174 [Saprolegnia parasitica CBS 223.65]KDO21760.1 hypothetical protein SPRG_13174 [Saprolegnia parasitica CBS 223.65]|eukprot:XP_012207560.1 hypothetical protein SPRG_13174 [Saprolegnia parasitica CBS 223.65]